MVWLFEYLAKRSTSQVVNGAMNEFVPSYESTDWEPRNLYDELDSHTYKSKHQKEYVFAGEFKVSWTVLESCLYYLLGLDGVCFCWELVNFGNESTEKWP